MFDVPLIFYQMLTMHAFVDTGYVPRVWVLMPNKHEKTYDRVFEALKLLANKMHHSPGFLGFFRN